MDEFFHQDVFSHSLEKRLNRKNYVIIIFSVAIFQPGGQVLSDGQALAKKDSGVVRSFSNREMEICGG